MMLQSPQTTISFGNAAAAAYTIQRQNRRKGMLQQGGGIPVEVKPDVFQRIVETSPNAVVIETDRNFVSGYNYMTRSLGGYTFVSRFNPQRLKFAPETFVVPAKRLLLD